MPRRLKAPCMECGGSALHAPGCSRTVLFKRPCPYCGGQRAHEPGCTPLKKRGPRPRRQVDVQLGANVAFANWIRMPLPVAEPEVFG